MFRTGVIAWLAIVICLPSTPAQTRPGAAKSKLRPDAIPGYEVRVIEGFTVLLSKETLRMQAESKDERKPLEVLELELKTIARLFPPKALNVLRNILIWVEWNEEKPSSTGRKGQVVARYYGGHQLAMLAKGEQPGKAKNVTILSMKALTQEHQPKRDLGGCVILHEIAHAVHDQLLGNDDPQVKLAYKQAMERKLYDPAQYVSTNEMEFFAEMTCSYFDQLEYYPKTRADLKKHDPYTYKLMEKVWGKRKDEIAAKTNTTTSVSLDKIKLGQWISGSKLTESDLRGRPALLLFWNAGSPSSLAALARLQTWNEELSDFGLVTVGVHLTAEGQATSAAESIQRSRRVAFTITANPWTQTSLVKDFGDFPLCLVFDHQGGGVYQGSPYDAESALRAAVGRALVAGTGCETFPKSMTTLVEALEKGKAPAWVLGQLLPLTRSNDADTATAAKALGDKIAEGGWQALRQAESLIKDDPVGAYVVVERLPSAFKGTPVATRAAQLLNRLGQDKAVALELRARKDLALVKKLDQQLTSQPGSFDPTSSRFRQQNGVLLAQLRSRIQTMNKSWPNAKATEEAVRIGEKYGVD
jgi:hypothetical protein